MALITFGEALEESFVAAIAHGVNFQAVGEDIKHAMSSKKVYDG